MTKPASQAEHNEWMNGILILQYSFKKVMRNLSLLIYFTLTRITKYFSYESLLDYVTSRRNVLQPTPVFNKVNELLVRWHGTSLLIT